MGVGESVVEDWILLVFIIGIGVELVLTCCSIRACPYPKTQNIISIIMRPLHRPPLFLVSDLLFMLFF